MTTNMTYDEALTSLRLVVKQIENEDIQLDTLAAKVKEAGELVKYCENKLRIIENEVNDAKGTIQ